MKYGGKLERRRKRRRRTSSYQKLGEHALRKYARIQHLACDALGRSQVGIREGVKGLLIAILEHLDLRCYIVCDASIANHVQRQAYVLEADVMEMHAPRDSKSVCLYARVGGVQARKWKGEVYETGQTDNGERQREPERKKVEGLKQPCICHQRSKK